MGNSNSTSKEQKDLDEKQREFYEECERKQNQVKEQLTLLDQFETQALQKNTTGDQNHQYVQENFGTEVTEDTELTLEVRRYQLWLANEMAKVEITDDDYHKWRLEILTFILKKT